MSFQALSYQPVGLDIPALIARARELGTTALQLLEDPYLSEFTCLITRLNAIEAGQNPGRPCKKTPKGLPGGIGLEDVITPIRVFTNFKQKPVLGVVGITLIVSSLVGLGYLWGKAK